MAKPKYAAVTPTLPRLPAINEEDSKYQERVNTRKKEITNGDLERGIAAEPRHASHLASKVAATREIRDELKDTLKLIQLDLEAYTQLLVDQYEAEGITSLKLADGGSVRIQYEPYATVEDRDKLRAWVMANGMERSLSLHPATANAVTKELLLNGGNPPDGIKAWTKVKTVYTRGE